MTSIIGVYIPIVIMVLLAGHGLINLIQHPEIVTDKLSVLRFTATADSKVIDLLEQQVKSMYTRSDVVLYGSLVATLIMSVIVLVWFITQCMSPPVVTRTDFGFNNITPFLRHRLNRNIAALQYLDMDRFGIFYLGKCNPSDSNYPSNAILSIINLSTIPEVTIRSSPDLELKDMNHYAFGNPMYYYELMLKWCDLFTTMQQNKKDETLGSATLTDKPKIDVGVASF